jgi:hydrogenase maturation protease
MSTPEGAKKGILILCLGNDVLRDDGVGWRVAEELERDGPPGAVIRRSSVAGFYLLDELVGFGRAVVVDAIQTGQNPPGTVLSFPLEAIHTPAGPSPHSVGLPAVLDLGRSSGLDLPSRIHVVAVEVEDMTTVTEGLTAAVQRAVVPAVQAVRDACARFAP